MSLTIQDIERLAELARIEVSDAEKESFLGDLNSIVGYISEIQSVAGDSLKPAHTHINVTRPDEITVRSSEYTEQVLQNAPARRADYVQVDQVIEQ
ncbi:MAG: Aspartyl/glutamyl-tRNA(Asn/Gln) amidotransferase, subunit [Candidatus Parcubacteria bacterium]|jgi:aspartyl-tRNA(Asn)/glutamyl-tRNA(Gln) amidotransferase subunit C